MDHLGGGGGDDGGCTAHPRTLALGLVGVVADARCAIPRKPTFRVLSPTLYGLGEHRVGRGIGGWVGALAPRGSMGGRLVHAWHVV